MHNWIIQHAGTLKLRSKVSCIFAKNKIQAGGQDGGHVVEPLLTLLTS